MIHPENLNNVEYYPFKNIKLIGSDWKSSIKMNTLSDFLGYCQRLKKHENDHKMTTI